MQPRSNRFWLLYLTLAILILIRLLPFVTGFGPLWGVAQLTFLPLGYTIGYCVIGLIALSLPFTSFASPLGNRLSSSFSNALFENRFGVYTRIGVVAACGAIFGLFAMPTHFLGDGYPYLANLGSSTGNWVKWTEGGAMQAVLAIQSVIGTTSKESAKLAFQILSVGSGAVTVWIFLLISRAISEEPIKRLLTFVALTLSPTLLLFFGYVESYPLMWGPLTGFCYFALKYINTGKGVYAAIICLLLAAVAHLIALIFIPALVFLLLCRGRGLELFKRHQRPAIMFGVAVVVVFVVLFVRRYSNDLYFQNLFLWAFTGKPIAPDYAIFSLHHLLDIINELLLVSPLVPVLLFAMAREAKRKEPSKAAVFFGIASLGVLLFLAVFDPSITMPRDWDLFALCGLPLTLFALARIPKRNLSTLSPLLVSFVLAALSITLSNLLVNLERDRSINQIKSIIDSFPEKSMGSIAILGTYFRSEGEGARADSCESRMQQMYPRLYQMRRARQGLQNRDLQAAEANFRVIEPDPYWKDYHLYLAERSMFVGRLDTALVHAKAAVQLQEYYQPGYLTLGLVYMARNELSDALATLRYGLSLDNRAPLLLLNLAVIHSWQDRQDSVLSYAKRLYEVDTTSVLGRCLLARGYYYAGEREQALIHARRYFEMGRGTDEYEKLKRELVQIMPELGE